MSGWSGTSTLTSGSPALPALLNFGAEQVEVDHQKFDDLSVTWNTIDPSQTIDYPDFHLAWRPEPLPSLADLPGRVFDHVELLEWAGNDIANGSVAVGFNFGTAWLTVYNALDENGFEHCTPGPNCRRQRLKP